MLVAAGPRQLTSKSLAEPGSVHPQPSQNAASSSTVVEIRADAQASTSGQADGTSAPAGDGQDTASTSRQAGLETNTSGIPEEEDQQESAPIQYDPNFHGPASADRSAHHDALAGVLLLALWAFLLFLMILSFALGRPAWLRHPHNAAGLLCGDSGAQRGLPYLWWPSSDLRHYYCVATCPSKGNVFCVNPTTYLQDSSAGCTGMTSLFDTVPIFSKCMPTRAEVTGGNADAVAAWKALLSQVNTAQVLVQAMLGDAWQGWWIILAAVAITVGLSHLLMTFLHEDPVVYVPLSMGGAVGMAGLMGAVILFVSGPSKGVAGGSTEYLGTLTNRRLSTVWWLAALAGVVGFLFLVLAGVLGLQCTANVVRGRVQLGIRLLNCAGQAVREVPLLIYLPQLTCIALCLLGTYAYVVGMYMHSMQLRLRGLHQNKYTALQLMWLLTPLHALGTLWMAAFILASTRITTAVVIGTWYWSREPRADKMEVLMVPETVQQNFACHAGSTALAALLVSLATPIQAVVKRLPNTTTMAPAMRAALLHLNGDAYVQIALHGTSLLESATSAAHLLKRQRKRVEGCAGAAAAVIFPGKVFTVVLSMLVAYWLATYIAGYFTTVITPVGIVAMAGIASAAISTAYCIVHDQAVETMLQCFCEDCERNDGSAMHPYYMPTTFKNIILEAATARHMHDADDMAQPSKRSQVAPLSDDADNNAQDSAASDQRLLEEKPPPEETFEDTPLAGFYSKPKGRPAKPPPKPKPPPKEAEAFADTPLAGFFG
ncbi:hypothetical protein WJX72_012270 [[Myrmecia] bisecta]|uniref:Choline transporter-like protein n=1 Tax=[Myrmecia] bisecta TaxID=41462 RepID=A0AAW1P610_9CHLO